MTGPRTPDPLGKRCFLFLQRPHGSFFPRLGTALAAAGQRVRRINFNGGDRATWPNGDGDGDGDGYRGLERGWSAHVSNVGIDLLAAESVRRLVAR